MDEVHGGGRDEEGNPEKNVEEAGRKFGHLEPDEDDWTFGSTRGTDFEIRL